MLKTAVYAAASATSPLAPFEVSRRDPGPRDVLIDIAYCGVRHTDLHFARNDWGFTSYPVVPGHEITGHVAAVGAEVTKYRVGDAVGVGCFIDSCRSCEQCARGEEQFCDQRPTMALNSVERDGSTPTVDVRPELAHLGL